MPQQSESSLITFRRLVTPLPTGKVRVQLEVRLGGGLDGRGSKLAGRISQVRGGWRYAPVGAGRRSWMVGEVFPTVEACKRSLLPPREEEETEASK